MDIRDIRLERFGAWEHVQVSHLSPGLNVVFLDDGARAVDFSRFIQGMLVGFESTLGNSHAGTLTFVEPIEVAPSKANPTAHASGNTIWRLDRFERRDGQEAWQLQIDDRSPTSDSGLLRRLLSNQSHDILEHLFVPSTTIDDGKSLARWNWLAQNRDLLESVHSSKTIKAPRTSKSHPFLRSAAELELTPHGRLLAELGAKRESLLERIAYCRAELVRTHRSSNKPARQKPSKNREAVKAAEPPATKPTTVVVPEKPVPTPPTIDPNLVADLQEELRQIRLQLPAVRLAADLADGWRELKKLRTNLRDSNRDIQQLKAALSEFQLLEDEKQDYRKTMARKPRTVAAKPKRSDEYTVRRLLEQRDWVTEAANQPTSLIDVSNDQHDELRHTAHLLITARREQDSTQRRLAEFTKRTQFDWTRLYDDPLPPAKRRLDQGLDVSGEPPERRLAELKRRRMWIREENRHVLDRLEFMPQIMTWLAILFTLSVCSVLGTLLVTSHALQWCMLALGLGGMVCTGALKLSLELRNSQRLNRSRERLQQIDDEILLATEQSLNKRQDAAAVRRIAEERLFAIQLQQDATEAGHRLDSAETTFRELLDIVGLPLSLSPENVDRVLRRRERAMESSDDRRRAHGKLRKWIKRTRDTIERIDGIRPGKDPINLLAELEIVFDQLRDQEHVLERNAVDSKFERTLRDEARVQLRRIEKRQRSILRKSNVEDQFALESEITSAESATRNRRRFERLQRELNVSLSVNDDPDEVRELLESHDAESLRFRVAELIGEREKKQSELEALEQSINEHALRSLESESSVTSPQLAVAEVEPPNNQSGALETVVQADSVATSQGTAELRSNELELRDSTNVDSLDQEIDEEHTRLRDQLQSELDALRVKLMTINTKIRKAMRWTQQSAVLRHVARVMINRPTKTTTTSAALPYLSELTAGRWHSLAWTEQGIELRNTSGERERAAQSIDATPAWLAIRLAYADQLKTASHTLPIVLLADELLNSPTASRTFQVLQSASDQGTQCLLLTQNQQLANQLGESGTPVVRIGLHETVPAKSIDGPAQDNQLVT